MTARPAAQRPMPSTKNDATCAVCAPLGPHTPGRHGGVLRWARRKELAAPRALAPVEVARGDRFIVVEDAPGDRLVADVVWVALFATGKKVGGYEEWRMDRAGKSGTLKARSLFPQLYPFLRMGRAPGAEA